MDNLLWRSIERTILPHMDDTKPHWALFAFLALGSYGREDCANQVNRAGHLFLPLNIIATALLCQLGGRNALNGMWQLKWGSMEVDGQKILSF